MGCETWQEKIELYADGELPAEEAEALQVHLRGCPACSAETLEAVQLKRAVRAAGRRFSPAPEFRARIRVQVAGKERPRNWRWLTAVAVAAVVIVAVGLAFLLGMRRWQRQQVLAELADLHVANLASATPVEVVSSDRHTVKPWFEGKLPFTFDLPDLAGSPFVLVGGRVTYLEHAPGAHLVFDLRRHHISVFICRDQGAVSRALPGQGSFTESGFNLATWNAKGLRYFVVGDVSREDVQALSALLKRE